MKRLSLFSVSATAVLLLAGCGLFYPNAGNNESPSDPMNPSPSSSQTPDSTESPSASPTPSEPEVVKENAKPRVLFTEIDYSTMELLVVAEIVNFAESTGTCTVSFVSGGVSIAEVSAEAEANVTTTQCFPMRLLLSKLPKGMGVVVVSYDSEKYAGSSKEFEVEIP
jgi:hypothetical protein